MKFICSVMMYLMISACGQKNMLLSNKAEDSSEESEASSKDNEPNKKDVVEPVQVSGSFLTCEIDLAVGHCGIMGQDKKKVKIQLTNKDHWKFYSSDKLIVSNDVQFAFEVESSPWHIKFRLPSKYVGEKIQVKYAEHMSWDVTKRTTPLKPLFSLLECQTKNLANVSTINEGSVRVWCDKGYIAISGSFYRNPPNLAGFVGDNFFEEGDLSGWYFRFEATNSVSVSVNCCKQK